MKPQIFSHPELGAVERIEFDMLPERVGCTIRVESHVPETGLYVGARVKFDADVTDSRDDRWSFTIVGWATVVSVDYTSTALRKGLRLAAILATEHNFSLRRCDRTTAILRRRVAAIRKDYRAVSVS